MQKFSNRILGLLAAAAFFIHFNCVDSKKDDLKTVQVRLETDADGLNPFLTNNANAVQVYQKIFLGLADFDPKTLELKPFLIKNLPTETILDTGVFKGGSRFDFEILPEATWDNGQPVTGNDFLFTFKTILLPKVAANIWRGYEDFIADIQVDAANPKRVIVFSKKHYMLAVETLTGVPILPETIYDPSGALRKVVFRDLLDPAKAADLMAKNADLTAFAEAFKSPLHTREAAGVSGCGPYKLDEMVTGQRIVVSKKTNWWGDKLVAERPLLQVFPQKIVYKPVTDITAALTLLKDGGLDVMKNIPAAQFDALKNDPTTAAKLNFFNPELMEYSVGIINTRRSTLADKRVRRALAHCLDLESGVKTIMGGYGRQAVGPFHPTKPYFNKDLAPIKFDIEKAKSLLAEAGWTDADKNGVVEKNINGKKTELALTVRVSPKSESGKAVALQLQANAPKAGIKIDLIQKDMTAIMEDFKTRDFDITLMRALQLPILDEPFQTWHTKSNTPDGGNRSGFGSAASDKIIDEIRETRDISRRNELYRQLQAMIYDEQPVLFLFVPIERIAVSKKWEPMISINRPGYFEQYFK